jgi:protein-tyrosine phosphatase
MIDIHCHIIPGVDDGSSDPRESLRMGEAAAACGVTDIIVTPHCNIPGLYGNYMGPAYDRAMGALRAFFSAQGVELKLHRGMEVFGTDNIGDLIDQDDVITLASSRYMLVEFAFDDDMWRVRDVIRDIQRRGITPIIAHPERYYAVNDDIQFALDWAEMGCLLQLNRTSLLGLDTREAADTSRRLLFLGAAHFVASDAHGTFTRSTELIDAYDYVRERISREAADILMEENPRRIIENRPMLRAPGRRK